LVASMSFFIHSRTKDGHKSSFPPPHGDYKAICHPA